MCMKCDTFRKHIEILKEVIGEYPAAGRRLQEVIEFLDHEQSNYVDDVVERDFRDE